MSVVTKESKASQTSKKNELDLEASKLDVGLLPDEYAEKKAKRRPFRLKIVLATVSVIVVVLGGSVITYATQHDNPRFCNAVCHQPMDAYVEGYYSENSSLLVAAHREDDVTCLQCHDASLRQQMDEGVKWATGDFKDPMEVRRFASKEFCLVEGCHAPFDELVQLTENYQGTNRNPHMSPHGQNECYNCHNVHKQSNLYCNQCHSDVSVPQSWR
jgi:hypothetical protein